MAKTKLCCNSNENPPDLRPIEGPAADGDLARLTKAVGHPIRVQILRLLNLNRNCVCGDLVDALPLAQSTVSQHLKVLKEAGLICGNVEGTNTCYCIDVKGLNRLKALVASI